MRPMLVPGVLVKSYLLPWAHIPMYVKQVDYVHVMSTNLPSTPANYTRLYSAQIHSRIPSMFETTFVSIAHERLFLVLASVENYLFIANGTIMGWASKAFFGNI